ncbi:hypothetical protein BGX23_012413 [Mortierella sp. AD031]|nr:hypothetical protein BGX23_012413 [Mortierella sp. AD031]
MGDYTRSSFKSMGFPILWPRITWTTALGVIPTIEDAEELEGLFYELLGEDVLSVAVLVNESGNPYKDLSDHKICNDRVVIGTPVRLSELVEDGELSVKRLDSFAIEGIDEIEANKEMGAIYDMHYWMNDPKMITGGLHQYCLTAFKDDEASTLYQLTCKVGSGRVVVYCKRADIVSSVADSLAEASTQDGLDVTDRIHSIVTMASGMSHYDCTEACKSFKTGDARILVFDEKMGGDYELPSVVLFVFYLESGLEGPDTKKYKACVGRSSWGKKKKTMSTAVHFRKDTVYVIALEEENNTKIKHPSETLLCV